MTDDINSPRFREILSVLKKHEIIKGLTPVKLREIIEDLGPTYIKLGQIMSMRSDFLPKDYCKELEKLRSNAQAMPFEEVVRELEEAYGQPVKDVFESIDEKPLGAASIAQVHKAVLKSGEIVVVKVERPHVYETMSKDIVMLRKGAKLLRYVSAFESVDFVEVLNEMWSVAKEEMNFLKEASNMTEFAKNNKGIAYIYVPKLYREYTTDNILVMEYIGDFEVDDKEMLLKNGYDLDEIGRKMVHNYIKQIIEDGFFHADPHPGNIRIQDGKIVWIDMGMMGHFTNRECFVLKDLIAGIADHDIGRVEDAVLEIGEITGKLDRHQLYQDIDEILEKYVTRDFSNMDLSVVMDDLLDVMGRNNIRVPSNLAMLVRGLVTIEGVLAVLSPSINIIEIAADSMKSQLLKDFDLETELKKDAKDLYKSWKKTIVLPDKLAESLKMFTRGEARVNTYMHTTEDLNQTLKGLVKELIIGLLAAAFLIGACIITATNAVPQIIGIPVPGFVCYVITLLLIIKLFIDYVLYRKEYNKQNRRYKRR